MVILPNPYKGEIVTLRKLRDENSIQTSRQETGYCARCYSGYLKTGTSGITRAA